MMQMTKSRIRVFPFEDPVPQAASLPLENAWRWISPHEDDGNDAPVSVFLTQSAFTQVSMHASSDQEEEVGGVLVGKWFIDSETTRQYIVVKASIPARFTQHGSSFLTFTRDSLVDIHERNEADYPQDAIVGWYHTHPRMGVFLSQYDIWLHNHFFPEPWQVALVIEPSSEIGGFFVPLGRGELDSSRYFGFYELDDNTGQSIVHWNNLQLGSAEAGDQGVNQHE
jgi:proteasome lid subunit RPN8/RPN11